MHARAVLPVVLALFIGVWVYCLAGAGLWAQFSSDDLMNLHGYLSRPFSHILRGIVCFWSTEYRPLGGLVYVLAYRWFGFDPLPLRIFCFSVIAFNLVLLYCFSLALSGRRTIAAFALLLASYHAWLIDLYESSGSMYEALCFAFYFSAFLYYVRLRQTGKIPGPRQIAVVLLLYVAALDAKEMAVTLPLFLLIYECIWHSDAWRRPSAASVRVLGCVLCAAALTGVYVAGKLTGPESLAAIPAYRPSISAGRFLDTFHIYLNPLFYQDHVFRDPNTIQLLLAMLALAGWMRSRTLLFAWCFLLLSILPVAFIPHYAALFLYLPGVGWALYLGAVIDALLNGLLRWFSRWQPRLRDARPHTAIACLVFLALAAWLLPHHLRERVKTQQQFRSAHPPSREVAAQLARAAPSLPHGAHVLFVDDPFPRDAYFLVFLTRLYYHDMSLTVERTWSPAPLPAADHRIIFRFRDGRFERATTALQPVDQARRVARAEAIVNVHDSNVAGAAIQHS